MGEWKNRMKSVRTLCIVALSCMIAGVSCQQQHASVADRKLENGWYHIVDEDSIIPTPIVTVKEFGTLRLDSDYYGMYSIVGQVCRSKRQAWADATERWIGKRIGFIFNDSLIASPQVNMRIESGNFQISTPQGKGIRSLYRSLLKEKEDSINALFKVNNWEKDTLLLNRVDAASWDSLINALDYGEAKALVRGFED